MLTGSLPHAEGSSGQMADKLLETGMYRDIMQQPDCWDTLLRKHLRPWQERVQSVRLGLLVGMGSSRYAALAAQQALSEGGAAWHATNADNVLHYFPTRVPYDAVLSISQSGETADTVAAAEKLHAAGLPLLSITNNPESKLARASDFSLDLGCGEEKGSATKTYTASVLALLASDPARTAGLSRLPEKGRAVLESFTPSGAADLLLKDKSHYFLGTGVNEATALEAALLCKEKLFLRAEGSGAAEFAHGPLEALDEQSVVWLFSKAERVEELLMPVAKRIRQTGASLVVIGENCSTFESAELSPAWTYDMVLEGPEELGVLLFILPVQMMVLWEAGRRGYPIDTFRRMDKVLTSYNYVPD
jgi:glutamine---fructose-6-phosphate transaminase (isomerizing)